MFSYSSTTFVSTARSPLHSPFTDTPFAHFDRNRCYHAALCAVRVPRQVRQLLRIDVYAVDSGSAVTLV